MRKRSDFKNTLYKSEIHLDKPYVSQNSNRNSPNRSMLSRKDSPKEKNNSFVRQKSIGKRELENKIHTIQTKSPNKMNINIIENKNNQEEKKCFFSKIKKEISNHMKNNDSNKISLNTLKFKHRKELSINNLNSTQISNINTSNTISNNKPLRCSDDTIIKSKPSDAENYNQTRILKTLRKTHEITKKTNEDYDSDKNFFSNDIKINNHKKITNIEKAKKIMYDNKMSKLINYFRQGGI